MLACTESFKKLKVEQQRILDFSVLICHSVPNIKKTIRGNKESIPYFSVPNPDYFNKSNNERLISLSRDYKTNLAKYILISSFSFFESYFRSVINELMNFHGGKVKYLKSSRERFSKSFENRDVETLKHIRKLQEPIKKKNNEKYKKYIDTLDKSSSYNRPSEILGSFGVKILAELVRGENFRSKMIPDILEFCFLLELSDKTNKHPELINLNLRETFDYLRNIRNSIGHGNVSDVTFSKTMDLTRYLRFLSLKFDKHLVKNFFILESV